MKLNIWKSTKEIIDGYYDEKGGGVWLQIDCIFYYSVFSIIKIREY